MLIGLRPREVLISGYWLRVEVSALLVLLFLLLFFYSYFESVLKYPCSSGLPWRRCFVPFVSKVFLTTPFRPYVIRCLLQSAHTLILCSLVRFVVVIVAFAQLAFS